MKLPANFQPIGPLPPMLLKMALVSSQKQFVAMYYSYTNPTWSDGSSTRTFSFYGVWQPLIQHPKVAAVLKSHNFNLGYDDLDPTHYLMCDGVAAALRHRVNQIMYVAPLEAAWEILHQQKPSQITVTKEEWQKIVEDVKTLPPPSMEEMRQMGMFELFVSPPPIAIQERENLT